MNDADARVRLVCDAFDKSNYVRLYPDVLSNEYMIVMRDDVKLRTIAVRPPGVDVCPCILTRSCYPHDEAFYMELAKQYAMRGIAFVVQFCRGTGGSEGTWEPNVHERNDGKDTADWLCSQDWVSSAGYWGSSYLALTGWIIADIVPEKMKTMYLTLYGTDRHVSAYQDGLFRHDVLTAWAMGNAGFKVEADYLQSCLYRPHARVDEDMWGRPLQWYRQWVTNTNPSDEYWQSGMWKTLQDIPPKVKIPISMSEGWYDHHLGSAIKTYEQLSQEAREKSEFIIGPWNHWFEAPLEGDEGQHYDCNDIIRAFEWFNKLLVKQEMPNARVSQYVIRGDYWMESDTLTPKAQKFATFYLSDGKDGLVEDRNSIHAGQRSYRYDPEDPIFSHGGETLLRSKDKAGSLLQPEPNHRPDIISFLSAPLKEDLTVCGSIRARLHVSSDSEDTAFIAKIIDVDEHGKGYNVRGGVTTLAYRGHSSNRQTYTPGETVEIAIGTWHIAWRFKKGHQVRIDIQSSDFPQYNLHTNTAGIWSEQTQIHIAKQTIFFDNLRPSLLELPLK